MMFDPTADPESAAAERAHLLDIQHAFRDYHNWMEAEIRRRERHAATLSAEDLALL